MELIQKIKAREILDSRGNPTIEVELETERAIARTSIPSGASTGIHEAMEIRDHDPKRYQGKGVLTAVEHVNTIIRNELVHQDMSTMSQRDIDKKLLDLDGTPNKSHLGANALLGVSLAFAKAKAFSMNMPLYKYFKTLLGDFASPLDQGKYVMPVPMMNILNGGKHADSGLDFQEFLIIPVNAPTFAEALRYGSEIFHTLKTILADRNLTTSVGDEGGFAPQLKDNEEAFTLILEAIEKAGYQPEQDIALAIDAASSSFYNKERKTYHIKRGKSYEHLSTQELLDYYVHLQKTYPILSIEDPFDEDDWDGFHALNTKIGKHVQIMGDDLFVTNPKRIAQGIKQKCANATLIKLNQIGTVTETVEAVIMAMKHQWATIVSHRSGETEDPTIADFAVGLGTGQIKTGSLSRTERIAKYNQLLRIEEKEGQNSIYPGLQAFYNIHI